MFFCFIEDEEWRQQTCFGMLGAEAPIAVVPGWAAPTDVAHVGRAQVDALDAWVARPAGTGGGGRGRVWESNTQNTQMTTSSQLNVRLYIHNSMCLCTLYITNSMVEVYAHIFRSLSWVLNTKIV